MSTMPLMTSQRYFPASAKETSVIVKVASSLSAAFINTRSAKLPMTKLKIKGAGRGDAHADVNASSPDVMQSNPSPRKEARPQLPTTTSLPTRRRDTRESLGSEEPGRSVCDQPRAEGGCVVSAKRFLSRPDEL
ncbi:hypothetical protein EYF80_015389 [Liparis tanakae]|uniref:Uncharacterized protein n=1 Tax=Liparis tanakae TaxID=230148 RepID=A0A4Z2I975_9TELE|nr:hypothetical protein EYF80_015389 [Liparis tanakae]